MATGIYILLVYENYKMLVQIHQLNK